MTQITTEQFEELKESVDTIRSDMRDMKDGKYATWERMVAIVPAYAAVLISTAGLILAIVAFAST